MIKNSLAFMFLLLSWTLVAQTDPVLMRVNGKEVLRSEFEHVCNKHQKLAGMEQMRQNECVDSFVNFKLKVVAAEAAGLDTIQGFREKLDSCRRQLVKSYLTDETISEDVARQFYNRMKSNRQAGQVRVSHVYKSLPQNVSSYTLRRVEARMDSIYDILKQQGTHTTFDVYVNNFSDDKKTFWVNCLQMPTEFEEVVFELPVGDISRPFFTPQGIHIVKVLEKKDTPSFNELKDEIISSQALRHRVDKGTESLVEKLKKEYNYTPDRIGIEELIAKGQTERVLFTLGSRPYTGKEFARFAASHPAGIQRQLKGFVMKTILDYETNQLEKKHPEFYLRMQEYREEMLVDEISNRKISEPSKVRENDLRMYFENHRSNYHWESPRYKGIVLHGTSKRVLKQVRKLLKALPEEEWLNAIRLTFNAGETPKVQAEKGLFARGDNLYVDDLVFKGNDAEPIMSFPFTAVFGEKMKGPKTFREVGEQLLIDYRNYLEQRWIAGLRAAGKVEINQEVLKTVNNH